MSAASEVSVDERRRSDREATTAAWMTCFLELSDGTTVEGVLKNISEGGAQVAAPTTNLHLGDHARIVIVLLGDQKVQCRCQIRHIDRQADRFGISFASPPEALDEDRRKRCTVCRLRHPASTNFCPRCGNKLQPA